MRVMLIRWGLIVASCFVLLLPAPPVNAQSEEKTLEEINQLPEAERQARLILC